MEGDEVAASLGESERKGHSLVFKSSHYTRGKDGSPNDVTPPLSADADKGDQDLLVMEGYPDPAYALSAGKDGLGAGRTFGTGRDAQDTFVLHNSVISCDCGTEFSGALSDPCPGCGQIRSGYANDVMPPLRVSEGGGNAAQKDNVIVDHAPDVAPTLFGSGAGTERVASAGSEADFIVTAFRPTAGSQSVEANDEISPSLKVGTGLDIPSPPAVVTFDTTQITHPENRSNPQPGAPSHPLAAAGHPPTITGVTPELADPITAHEQRTYTHEGTNFRLRNVVGQAPRRLTPRECERLQGWPDDWTAWGIDAEGNRVELKDGPRYRMCGNGVTSTVAEWIGRNIVAADEEA